MIAIAMEPPLETEEARRVSLPNISPVGRITELSGGDSTLENVTIGGIGKQRIKKAAANGEQTYEKQLEYEF